MPVAVIGLLAIPVMLSHNYDKSLISGTVCAGGSLGTAIPPSILIIVLGPVADVSVGDPFSGMIVSGLLMAGLFIAYIIGRAILDPTSVPRVPAIGDEPGFWYRLRLTIVRFLPPVALVTAVLGSILFGLATPTEAAACGALGTIILSLINRAFDFKLFWSALRQTVLITAMILTILLAGSMFAGIFISSGGIGAVKSTLATANLGDWGTLFLSCFSPLSPVLCSI